MTSDTTPPTGTSSEPSADQEDLKILRAMSRNADALRAEIGKTVIGQREVVDRVLTLLLAGGHGLLIGLPGLAKTTLVSTVARVLDLSFRRIQFTPDLMPGDITGTDILTLDPATGARDFRFVPGPVFCHLLLADEINRTPPKTQAALLEAMQEKSVTVGGVTHAFEEPFLVLATQNPIEQEGTYPLPEAQLDRFMFSIRIDYPDEAEERAIVRATTQPPGPPPGLMLSREDVLRLQRLVRRIPVSDHVLDYAVRLARATRPTDAHATPGVKRHVAVGAGPRAGLFLVLAAKARAVLEGRLHVSTADIRDAAPAVLTHRVIPNFAADADGVSADRIIRELLADLPANPEPA